MQTHTNHHSPQVAPPIGGKRRSGSLGKGLVFRNGKAFGSDRVGLVGYHDEAFVISKPSDVFASWLPGRVDRLPGYVRGCTNIAAGLHKANDMLARCPRGVLRKVWLLTDGYDTHGGWRTIEPSVVQAKKLRININTIGFGDAYDRTLLERIAGATHNGKFVDVQDLCALSDALTSGGGPARRVTRNHRAETAILVIDCSGSMISHMNGKPRIEVVREAVGRLLIYKQRMFS